jgi:phosphoribosylformimino-5-aminoimidazole carboxamide ribotide isomerase
MVSEILPAIDLKDGKVVRLTKGDFNQQTIYSNNPVEVAKKLLQLGTKWIHVVNLDGSLHGGENTSSQKNLLAIKELVKFCEAKRIFLQVGGGIRSKQDFEILIELGIQRIIVGTIAVTDPELVKTIIQQFSERAVLSLDVLEDNIMIKGWQENSTMKLDIVIEKYLDLGAQYFLITDISRDGTLSGVNHDLYNQLLDKYGPKGMKLIASGGIKDVEDIDKLDNRIHAAIIGKAYYNGSISDNQLSDIIVKYQKSLLVKRIIPCLDVKDGRVVKGVNFVNLRDSGDPIELAKLYTDLGADELVFLDITATLENRQSVLELIAKVSDIVDIPFTVGGGIRSITDISNIIYSGAEKVSINSAAINNPELITQASQKFGSQCIVVAIDAKYNGTFWEVFLAGGTKPTGIDAVQWSQDAVKLGAGELLITSMDRDGTLNGFDIDLLKAITYKVNVPVIASGGAGKLEHFKEAADAGCEALLAASLFHDKKIEIHELKSYLFTNSLDVR